MSATVEVVDDVRGILVKLGLGQPVSRAFVVGSVVGGVAYLAGLPKQSFRDDGSMKPLKALSPEPDATNLHFLLIPVGVATAVFLFT